MNVFYFAIPNGRGRDILNGSKEKAVGHFLYFSIEIFHGLPD